MNLIKKATLKILGNGFSHLKSSEIVLILLSLLQKNIDKNNFSEEFIQALIYHVQQEGTPLNYKFTNGGSVNSKELKGDLDELHDFGYLIFKETFKEGTKINLIEISPKGQQKVDVLLTAITPKNGKIEISKSIIPIKQLLA